MSTRTKGAIQSRSKLLHQPGLSSIMVVAGTTKAIHPIAAKAVREFAKAILHGNARHKAWLIMAAERFVEGKPVRKQRGL